MNGIELARAQRQMKDFFKSVGQIGKDVAKLKKDVEDLQRRVRRLEMTNK